MAKAGQIFGTWNANGYGSYGTWQKRRALHSSSRSRRLVVPALAIFYGVQCHEFPARFLEGVAQIRALHEEQERRRWEVKQLQLMEKERKKREAAQKREEKQAEKALRKKFRPKVTPQRWPWRQRRRRRRRTSTYDWQHRQHDYQAEQDRREREERERQQRERQGREKKTYPKQLDDALEVLGLTRPYTLLQVKTAFRQLAKRHHPDCMGDPEKFKEAHNAYELVVKDLKVTV